jgi:hypothetical protein
MRPARYREAVYWIAHNDDTEWIRDEEGIVSVTAVLVCDLFDVAEDKLRADLRRALAKGR